MGVKVRYYGKMATVGDGYKWVSEDKSLEELLNLVACKEKVKEIEPVSDLSVSMAIQARQIVPSIEILYRR